MILICGPCVVEDRDTMLDTAQHIKNIRSKIQNLDIYFKSSCVKDNRTKLNNYYGPGFPRGLELLTEIREFYNFKIVTDFHSEKQIREYSHYVDMIQIPAYLAMQTDLIRSAVEQKKPLNIKKPQFLNPDLINQIVLKVYDLGHKEELIITERGMCFGFNHLVVDPRSISLMRKRIKTENPDKDVKIIIDCTHPNKYWGDYTYCYDLAKMAMALNSDGLFIETHPSPIYAKCDSDTQLPVSQLLDLLKEIKGLQDA
jgi:2-dehydro-3-deoxyphosphooctonate aldolase (KDO 8-P synthase)